MTDNIGSEVMEFMELLDFTFSNQFVEKWRFKYSEKILKHFQDKMFQAVSKQKPLKMKVLFNHLTKKCKYSEEYVSSLFRSIDIDIYRPFVTGNIS